MKLKIALPLVTGLLASCIVGFQMMTAPAHIPDGNRILVSVGYLGIAILTIGVLASLYLIGKANRNINSYLKAYNVIAVLLAITQCSQWMEKFQGPEKQIVSIDGKYVVTAPSDWAILKSPTEGVNFQIMDWAGTGSLAILPAGEIGEMDPQAALAEVRANMNSQFVEKLGAAIGKFECGKNCVGNIYPIVSRGKPMHLFTTVKLDGNDFAINVARRELHLTAQGRARLDTLCDDLGEAWTAAHGREHMVAQALRDPGNLGTMLRTGDAVGAGGLILIDDCADPFSVEAVRASRRALGLRSRDAQRTASSRGRGGAWFASCFLISSMYLFR